VPNWNEPSILQLMYYMTWAPAWKYFLPYNHSIS